MEDEHRRQHERDEAEAEIEHLLAMASAVHEACCIAPAEDLAKCIRHHASDEDWAQVVSFARAVLRLERVSF
jgi:hypothetical protein